MSRAQYFESHTARHQHDLHGQHLLGAMLRAQAQGLMTHAEVVGNLILLAIAGNETTTKLIGNMAYRLWEHPEQRRWLIEDPTLIPKAIEETLRFDGSSQILVRRVGHTLWLRGKELKQGDRVGLCVISANRDADKFEDPEVFDIRAARAITWRSVTACTPVSARRWRAWRRAWCSKKSCAACRTTRSRRRACDAHTIPMSVASRMRRRISRRCDHERFGQCRG